MKNTRHLAVGDAVALCRAVVVEPAAVAAPEPPQHAAVTDRLAAADGGGVKVDVVVEGNWVLHGEYESSVGFRLWIR